MFSLIRRVIRRWWEGGLRLCSTSPPPPLPSAVLWFPSSSSKNAGEFPAHRPIIDSREVPQAARSIDLTGFETRETFKANKLDVSLAGADLLRRSRGQFLPPPAPFSKNTCSTHGLCCTCRGLGSKRYVQPQDISPKIQLSTEISTEKNTF